jgi:hypothetical protein
LHEKEKRYAQPDRVPPAVRERMRVEQATGCTTLLLLGDVPKFQREALGAGGTLFESTSKNGA